MRPLLATSCTSTRVRARACPCPVPLYLRVCRNSDRRTVAVVGPWARDTGSRLTRRRPLRGRRRGLRMVRLLSHCPLAQRATRSGRSRSTALRGAARTPQAPWGPTRSSFPRAGRSVAGGQARRTRVVAFQGGVEPDLQGGAEQRDAPQQRRRVAIVVGGGPVGLACCAALSKRSFDVICFEANSEPRLRGPEGATSGTVDGTDTGLPELIRTYPMSLSSRSVGALATCGLENVKSFAPERRLLGFKFVPEELDSDVGVMSLTNLQAEGGDVYLVDRHTLTLDLLEALRNGFMGDPQQPSMSIKFDSKVLSVDLQNRTVLVETTGGRQTSQESFRYDLLIGAEGAGGKIVRRALEGQGEIQSRVVLSASKSYKCFHNLEVPKTDVRFQPPQTGERQQGCWLFVMKRQWARMAFWTSGPGDTTTDVKLSVLFSCDSQYFDPETFAQKLEEAAPDLPKEMLFEMARQNRQHWESATLRNASSGYKPIVFGRIVKNSSFHGPRTALVGDAAHAVTSALGQGCNCGLGSVEALAQALDSEDDLDAVLENYSATRLPEAHALQSLEWCSAMASRSTEATKQPTKNVPSSPIIALNEELSQEFSASLQGMDSPPSALARNSQALVELSEEQKDELALKRKQQEQLELQKENPLLPMLFVTFQSLSAMGLLVLNKISPKLSPAPSLFGMLAIPTVSYRRCLSLFWTSVVFSLSLVTVGVCGILYLGITVYDLTQASE
eukprot:scaffold7242_cov400-Prasinococcus_capsulatus_cf.AAC.3